MTAEIEGAADVRVGDLPGELDLPLEALEHPRLVGDGGTDGLQGHRFSQVQVLGLVHLAHAAAPQQADDAVAAGDEVVREEQRLARLPDLRPLRRGEGLFPDCHGDAGILPSAVPLCHGPLSHGTGGWRTPRSRGIAGTCGRERLALRLLRLAGERTTPRREQWPSM